MSRTTKITVGDKFERLTVFSLFHTIVFSGGRNRKLLWAACVCDCGKHKSVRASHLTAGLTKSCGCLQSENSLALANILHKKNRLPFGNAVLNSLYTEYKRNAGKRGHAFLLSKPQFDKLVVQDCNYCNSPPSQKRSRNNAHFIYNGIDRVNNAVGYTESNCVSCCGKCNYMKRGFSKDDFLQHVRLICAHTK